MPRGRRPRSAYGRCSDRPAGQGTSGRRCASRPLQRCPSLFPPCGRPPAAIETRASQQGIRYDAAMQDLREPSVLNDPAAIKAALVRTAREHGFDIAGITKPDAIPQALERLQRFLADGGHGDMDWMETTAT